MDIETKILLHDVMNKLQTLAGRVEQAGKAATDLIGSVQRLSVHLDTLKND